MSEPYASSAGEFQPAQVATPTGKAAGRVLALPGGKTKFSVTITVRESK